MGMKGAWKTEIGKETSEFQQFLATLKNDLAGYSKSAHGIALEKESSELIGLLNKTIAQEDVAKLAADITKKIEKLAKLSSTPSSVYKNEN